MVNQDLLTRNIIHNLLGSFIDNVNSINAIEIAKSRNIKISTLQNDQPSEYNTLIRLTLTTDRRSRSVAGSIFGGQSRIVEIKGIKIDAELGNFNVYLTNKDKVGVINSVKQNDSFYESGDRIGKSGIDKSYEKILRGKKGVKHIIQDVKGKQMPYQNGIFDTLSIPGRSITLTIDLELQEFAEKIMQNVSKDQEYETRYGGNKTGYNTKKFKNAILWLITSAHLRFYTM